MCFELLKFLIYCCKSIDFLFLEFELKVFFLESVFKCLNPFPIKLDFSSFYIRFIYRSGDSLILLIGVEFLEWGFVMIWVILWMMRWEGSDLVLLHLLINVIAIVDLIDVNWVGLLCVLLQGRLFGAHFIDENCYALIKYSCYEY